MQHPALPSRFPPRYFPHCRGRAQPPGPHPSFWSGFDHLKTVGLVGFGSQKKKKSQEVSWKHGRVARSSAEGLLLPCFMWRRCCKRQGRSSSRVPCRPQADSRNEQMRERGGWSGGWRLWAARNSEKGARRLEARAFTSSFAIALAPGGESSGWLPAKTERGACPSTLHSVVPLGETPGEPPSNPLPHSRSERVGDLRHKARRAAAAGCGEWLTS